MARKRPGRRRLEIVAEPEWIDSVAAAARADDRSLSSFIRMAVNERAARLGILLAAEDASPRGRPRIELEEKPPAKKPRGRSKK